MSKVIRQLGRRTIRTPVNLCYKDCFPNGNLENMECQNAGMPESPESRNPRNNYKNYELKNKLIKLN